MWGQNTTLPLSGHFSGAHRSLRSLTTVRPLQKALAPGPLLCSKSPIPGEVRLISGPDIDQPLHLVRIIKSESVDWLLFSDTTYS